MKVKIEVKVDNSETNPNTYTNTMPKRTIKKLQPQQRQSGQDGREYGGSRGGKRGGGRGGGAFGIRKQIKKNPKSDIICGFFMQGKCLKTPEECIYSHNAVPPKKMEVCKFWMMDSCAKGEKCLYLHGDFPCKFFHTGLLCKQAEWCKFSHKPLNDITKTLLLKHIETAPVEILGDFPILNRGRALDLINKTESKIIEPGRPKGNLQEQMVAVEVGGYYRDTLESQLPQVTPLHIPPPRRNYLCSAIPSPTGDLQVMPTNSTARTASFISQQSAVSTRSNIPPSDTIQPKQEPDVPATLTEIPYWNTKIVDTRNASVRKPSNILHDSQEHPQQEWFLRIQEQFSNNGSKLAYSESDDEKPDDNGWYTSDEDNEKSSSLKDNSSKDPGQNCNPSQTQPNLDLSSVISSTLQTVESPKINTHKVKNTPSTATSRGDVDLRKTGAYGGGRNQPFGDIDFRVPIGLPDLRDIDFRLTSSHPVLSAPSTSSQNTCLKLRSGPSSEIDASVNSHPPVEYKLKSVLGTKKPNYSYIRHTMTPTQLLMDPRLVPRTGVARPLLAPPSSSSYYPASYHSPITIPANDNVVMDHRVPMGWNANSRGQQQRIMPRVPLLPSQKPGLLGDPRCPKDPRAIQFDVLTGRWLSQAAQPSFFPNFPNAHRFPNSVFQPDFSGLIQGGRGQQIRNNNGQGRGLPVSSWERYSQQQFDQDGSNIGTPQGISPWL